MACAAPPGAGSGLPKPKKRIAAPELHKGDSDSEEDEPAKKKNSLQPKPLSKPAVATTPSPSAIKAAAKSAALQGTKQITQEEDDSDEELEPENFFSLSDKSEPSVVSAETYVYSGTVVTEDLPPGTEPEPEFQDAAANAPLEFKTAAGSSNTIRSGDISEGGLLKSDHTLMTNLFSSRLQDYYPSGYYPEMDPALGPAQEMSTDSSFMDDEAFKRLQGKRNRGREEINFVEIKGDDQLSGAQQWMTKSLTEEKTMKSFSKKKGEQPTGQQRRKHQITYLIHQAKERELELKNTWSENKLSRRQTQAKYGF
ncbi:Proline-rich protein PRCC [Chelonia mydas]|uniref:Proline-rich protein PRCC n=1 Tax=Chelonia mydas TaxID=8469 RepID=M7BGZ0_CHEMY|nr:Proline-rich protein PRCC [Chelonia mydas]